jgi:hypothetical protein
MFRNFRYSSSARRAGMLAAALAAAVLGSGPGTASASDPVIAAAGDIACDPRSPSFKSGGGTPTECRQRYTSNLLVDAGLSAVLPLGDTQYENGAYRKLEQSYDPTWGRVKAITHPAVGNHEYLVGGARGYFRYFGAAAGDRTKGYYSFDIGAWHLVALNSNCPQVGGCGPGSPQVTWLRQDLATHPVPCVLAYWHHPRFSSGPHGSEPTYSTFWEELYNAGAEVVLNGHDHDYERFAPQAPNGSSDTTYGIREFVVGTGGKTHYGFTKTESNSEVRNGDTFGVLKLTLRPMSYDWQFVPEPGASFTDSGSTPCHAAATAVSHHAVGSGGLRAAPIDNPFSRGPGQHLREAGVPPLR